MSLITISNNTILLQVKKYWFENVIFILLLFYTLFYFTPSSYGKALETMGIPNDGLFFGTPQAVRSDEWVVWTPYLQALVNNNFHRFNAYSIYHEDFRNFNALPIYDWALIFKPQFWSFLIAEPARAFFFPSRLFNCHFHYWLETIHSKNIKPLSLCLIWCCYWFFIIIIFFRIYPDYLDHHGANYRILPLANVSAVHLEAKFDQLLCTFNLCNYCLVSFTHLPPFSCLLRLSRHSAFRRLSNQLFLEY